ncbi:MAG: cyclopropane-fatty-acyl-phospholipid synthase [Planctomycetota bacterium]|nr:cyclopropane-fatty-acyl-phospholipid synthase [Planctomycetota bacterium]MDA1211157.1 cyclopropane-fatty-acyl-phospholipid synthase [Planctomycetota bacterium]
MAVTIGKPIEQFESEDRPYVDEVFSPQPLPDHGCGGSPSDRHPTGWIARHLAHHMVRMGRPLVTLKSWKGEILYDAGPQSVGTIHFLERPPSWSLWRNPQLCFAEGYVDGKVVVEGELKSILLALFRAQVSTSAKRSCGWLSEWWPHRKNTLTRARNNVHHHYDIGNDFYRLWLDRQLLYTCAFFHDPSASLEEAQIAKMNRVCRKLWLKPGEHVVEAGCGWGSLALHMAREFGVKVTAYNISREQIVYARERARLEQLDHLVTYVEDDWRNISGTYDAFVSVGMLEHVGTENYVELGDAIRKCLPVHGRGLIHSIGRNRPRHLDAWTEKYIFPGAYPPALSEMTDIFEQSFFSILDVENLRRHYTLTLDHWLDRFERHVENIREMFDERFVRMWRMYLAASSATFEAGELQLFQVVFAPGKNNHIPWSRDGLLSVDGEQCRSASVPLFIPSPIPFGE